MRKTLFEADSKTKLVKALGVELMIDLSKLKILVNGVDLTDSIRIIDLKVVSDEE